MSFHKKRAEERAKHKKPINVSVMVDGVIKVIPYEEYEKDYLNVEEVEDGVEPTPAE